MATRLLYLTMVQLSGWLVFTLLCKDSQAEYEGPIPVTRSADVSDLRVGLNNLGRASFWGFRQEGGGVVADLVYDGASGA